MVDQCELKACRRCKRILALTFFSNCKNTACGKRAQCKECERKTKKEYLQRPEVIQKYAEVKKKHYLNNRRDILQKRKTKEEKERLEQKKAQDREALKDWYVRAKLRDVLPKEAITPELVELKRSELLLRRLARDLKVAADKKRKVDYEAIS